MSTSRVGCAPLARKVLAFLAGQVKTAAFLTGFVWFYIGVSGFSVPLARTIAGLLLMALALYPYLRRAK